MKTSIAAKVGLGLLSAALLVGASVFGYGFAETGRDDCPGRITCPLTGEEVCRDRCPLLESKLDIAAKEVPPCCRAK